MVVTKRSVPVPIGKMDGVEACLSVHWENASLCDGSKSAGYDNYFREHAVTPFLMIAIVITETTLQFLVHRIRYIYI